MLIQAIDNRLYKNPVIYGENYYIKFEEMEEPVIIIKNNNSTMASSRRRVLKILNRLNIKAKVSSIEETSLYSFPPSWVGLESGSSWEFQLKGKIPIPEQYSGVVDSPAIGESIKYIWELKFPLCEVMDFTTEEGCEYPLLVNFILGVTTAFPINKRVRNWIIKKINNQLENPLNFNLDSIILKRE